MTPEPTPAAPPPRVLTFEAVSAEEELWLRERRAVQRAFGAPPGAKDAEAGWSALCLSGGGIRSATFNLGVLQALARSNALPRFDALSTVSGGGYIGSWFSAWVRRDAGGLEGVRAALGSPAPGVGCIAPVGYLRKYSRFLSPILGLFSGDTWTLVATTVRDLAINLAMWIPMIVGAVALARVLLISVTARFSSETVDTAAWIAAAAAGLASGAALFFLAVWGLPSHAPAAEGRTEKRRLARTWVWIPILVVVYTYLQAVLWWRLDRASDAGVHSWTVLVLTHAAPMAAPAVGIILATLKLRGGLEDLRRRLVCGLIAGGVAMIANEAVLQGWHWLAHALIPPAGSLNFLGGHAAQAAFITLAVPARGLALLLGAAAFIAVESRLRTSKDEDREWWSRTVGYVLLALTLWAVGALILVVAPLLLRDASSMVQSGVGLGGMAGGGLVALAGRSAFTKGLGELRSRGVSLLPFAAVVGLLLIFSGAAVGVDALHLAASKAFTPPAWLAWAFVIDHDQLVSQAGGLIVGAVLLAAALLIDVGVDSSRFTPHAGYRNRLTRAYLGASRRRNPDPVTGFDERDNLYMWELRPWSVGVEDLNPETSGRFAAAVLTFDEALALRGPEGDRVASMDELAGLLAAGHDDRLRTDRRPAAASRLTRWIETAAPTAGPLVLPAAWSADADPWTPEKVEALRGVSRRLYNRLTLAAWFPEHVSHPSPASLARLAPLHTLNVTLNVGQSADPGLQDRHAYPMTISPLHCGAAAPGLGFRPSEVYGGIVGISLGTALAISGAAASPNTGYHPSKTVGFLMMLANVRLGWWLGNPGPDGNRCSRFIARLARLMAPPRRRRHQDKELPFRRRGLRYSLYYSVREALGLTTHSTPYVYLSDGGHFDNLGVYEMLRRRCDKIVAVDAGQDGGYAYQDLATLLRRANSDFGVESREIKPPGEKPPGEALPPDQNCKGVAIPPRVYRMFELHYPAAGGAPAKTAVLVCLKLSLPKETPLALLSHKRLSAAYPHDPTGNQFYDEDQFESYRELGMLVGTDALSDPAVLTMLGWA